MKSKVKSKQTLDRGNSGKELPQLLQNAVTGKSMLPIDMVKTECTPAKAYEENTITLLNKSPNRKPGDGSEMRESGDIVSTV